MTTIHNVSELAARLGTTVNRLKHDFPRLTDCGATVEWTDEKIQIAAVEKKSGTEFACDPLVFPFTTKDLDGCLERLENETFDAWCIANLQELGKL